MKIEEGATRQGMQQPPDAGTGKDMVFWPQLPEGSWLGEHPDFSLQADSGLLTSREKDNKFVLFEATKFVMICYSCKRRLTYSDYPYPCGGRSN